MKTIASYRVFLLAAALLFLAHGTLAQGDIKPPMGTPGIKPPMGKPETSIKPPMRRPRRPRRPSYSSLKEERRDRRELLLLEARWMRASQGNAPKKLDILLDNDAYAFDILYGGAEPRSLELYESKQQFLEDIKSGATRFTEFTVSNVTPEMHGPESNQVAGCVMIKGRLKGDDVNGRYLYRNYYVKKEQRWVIQSTQLTQADTIPSDEEAKCEETKKGGKK